MLKNKTKISKEAYLLLCKRLIKIFTLVVVLWVIAVALYLGFENIQTDTEFAIIMWAVGGVAAIVLVLVLPKLIRKLMSKTMEKNPLANSEVSNLFEFDEDCVFVTSTRAEVETLGNVRLRYDDFLSVSKFDNILALKLKSNQSYIVDLNCMTEGTADQLVELLKNKIGEKNFKICKK